MKIRWIRTVGIILAVYLGMRYILPVVLPFLIAFFIARLLYPIALAIESRWGWKHLISCTLVFAGGLLLVALVVAAALYVCYHTACHCVDNVKNICDLGLHLQAQLFDQLRNILGTGAEPMIEKLQGIAGELVSGLWDCSKDMGRIIALLGANTIVTMIASFLILQDYQKIRLKILQNPVGKYMTELLAGIKKDIGAYAKAELKIMLTIMAICIAGMLCIGSRYGILLGIVIGIFDALPFVGTGLILVPWALAQILLRQYGRAAVLFSIYLICTLTRQILEPKLVAEGVGVAPLAVLISIYVGIYVYGISGVILGPLSALVINYGLQDGE